MIGYNFNDNYSNDYLEAYNEGYNDAISEIMDNYYIESKPTENSWNDNGFLKNNGGLYGGIVGREIDLSRWINRVCREFNKKYGDGEDIQLYSRCISKSDAKRLYNKYKGSTELTRSLVGDLMKMNEKDLNRRERVRKGTGNATPISQKVHETGKYPYRIGPSTKPNSDFGSHKTRSGRH